MTAARRLSIAIVGIASRLPGAAGPEETWQLLRSGVDAVGDRPADRLAGPDRGGFVDGVDRFDAGFFRMSPREAADTDPQQRLALELAWLGLEDAGIAAGASSRVGVFLGVMAGDYADLVAVAGVRGVSRHTLTGLGRSMIANRISYLLRLAGPSFTVDAGQSSSLVAVHLACESLRAGEAEVALAGGVHLMVSPLGSAAVEAAGALSPDGRCHVFDERANGYVRGEGGGVVVLKPLARAVADGDRVYAVIEGSAVGTGSDESGLTVPSSAAQARTIAAALDAAGLAAADVQYVELHGTGTRVGDPVEAAALGAAYGRERRSPLVVGSVKTNIGHLEGAAGIAGLIKTVLCLDRRELVPSLHFVRANPRIPLAELGLRVATAAEPWPDSGGGPVAAGVTSLGIGGTCCHLVLGAAPPPAAPEPVPVAAPAVVPVLVSARGETALRAQADRLRTHLHTRPELSLLDVGFSTAVTRTHLERRAVVLTADRTALLTGLKALSAGEPAAGVVDGQVVGDKAVFVFPGQGAQWPGMAVGLLDSSPAFAEEITACEKALLAYVDWSVVEVLRGAPGAPSLERVDVVQPVLFAVMVSLAKLWRSYGVEPIAVVGHSQGEIAAAYVAGGLSLEDAARIVVLRSGLVRDRLAGRGGMVSVTLPADQVEQRISGYAGRVSVAAVNGPAAVVVSGEPADLDDLVAACERVGVRARRVPVDYASHSAQVAAVEAELVEALATIRPRSGTVPFFSTVAERVVDTAGLDAAYWYRNLRGRVGFEPVVRALVDSGANCFVEVSPHPVLAMAVEQTIEALDAADRVAVVGSLRRDEGGPQRFAVSLAEAHVAGVPVDWAGFYADTGARRVELPTYAFQRQSYWLTPGVTAGDVTAAGLGRLEHPVLAAAALVGDRDEWLLTGRLSQDSHPWTRDHAVFGTVILPGTALVELALTAGRHTGCPVVDELVLEAPLVLADDTAVQVQVVVGAPDDDGRREMTVYSRTDAGQATRHAHGTVAPAPAAGARWQPGQWPPAGAEPVAVDALQARLALAGHDLGPAFHGLRAAWHAGQQVYAEVVLPDEQVEAGRDFGLHPALLDAALQARLGSPGLGAGAPATVPAVKSGSEQAKRMR